MGYAADVAAVDTHAEGVGGDDDFELAIGEGGLYAIPVVALHAGVIGRRSPSGRRKSSRFFLGPLAGRTVGDCRAPSAARRLEALLQQPVDHDVRFTLALNVAGS